MQHIGSLIGDYCKKLAFFVKSKSDKIKVASLLGF